MIKTWKGLVLFSNSRREIMAVALPILSVISANFPEVSKSYERFALEKDKCRSCALYSIYGQVTQAEGCTHSPTFMFIGEAPGADEVEKNRPFIGAAGQRLRQELRKFPSVFNKKTTLISNVVACRPENNKFPDHDVANACFGLWLEQEIRLVRPKIIVALGNQPLRYIRNETGITTKRGTWKHLGKYGAWSFATYHPSYVIRQERAKDEQVIANFEADIAELAISWQDKTKAE